MNQNLATMARYCAVGLLVATMALPLQAALAADLIVTKFTDSLDGSCDSDCSLREAVEKANRASRDSRIILAAGTYSLSIPPLRTPDDRFCNGGDDMPVDDDLNLNGDLDIKGQLTIVGRGIGVTIIDAGHIDRVAEVMPGAVATLSKLTVRNGRHCDGGAGLWVNARGTLSLQSSAVTNNLAQAFEGSVAGSGIWNGGTLIIDASRIGFNTTRSGEGSVAGGGIYNLGSLAVRDAHFIGNSTIDENEDYGQGGAIYNSGMAEIHRASFENNSVSRVGRGAAILNECTGVLWLESSTVSGNTNGADAPESNGAIENGGCLGSEDRLPPAVITGTARLVNVTIAGNEIYGLVNRSRLSIVNSIVAGNGNGPIGDLSFWDSNCLNLGTRFQFSQTGLLRGSDSGNCPSTLLVLNADTFVTVLQPLALNNWQTPTFALRPGSIAIDAAVGSCPGTDQRRVSRPRDGNGDRIAACDLGAYER